MSDRDSTLRVPRWHRATSDAIAARDRRTLHRLHREARWALKTMHGRELYEANALLARIEAGLRFVPRRFRLLRGLRHG